MKSRVITALLQVFVSLDRDDSTSIKLDLDLTTAIDDISNFTEVKIFSINH